MCSSSLQDACHRCEDTCTPLQVSSRIQLRMLPEDMPLLERCQGVLIARVPRSKMDISVMTKLHKFIS